MSLHLLRRVVTTAIAFGCLSGIAAVAAPSFAKASEASERFVAEVAQWMTIDARFPAEVRLEGSAGAPEGEFLVGSGRLGPANGLQASAFAVAQWVVRYFRVPAGCELDVDEMRRTAEDSSSAPGGRWLVGFGLTTSGLNIQGWGGKIILSESGDVLSVSGSVPRITPGDVAVARQPSMTREEVTSLLRQDLAKHREGDPVDPQDVLFDRDQRYLQLNPARVVWRGMAGSSKQARRYVVDLTVKQILSSNTVGGVRHSPITKITPFEPGDL